MVITYHNDTERRAVMSEQLAEDHGKSNEDAEGQDSAVSKYRRRALILGAAAGVGAAASLVTKPEVAAANGTPVELGKVNTASATTEVTTSSGRVSSGSRLH
jgi:hypothetical protein